MREGVTAVHKKPHLPLENVPSCMEFGEAYGGYVAARDDLHEAEWQKGTSPANLLRYTVDAREQVARAVLCLYEGSDTIDAFDKQIEDILDADETVQLEGERSGYGDPRLAAYLARVSMFDSKTPSPVEAIVTTKRNLGIATEFADLAAQHASGMLMSGANAWGAFYEVKGDKPIHPLAENAAWREAEASDIDLLMTFANTDNLEAAVNDLCAAEVVEPVEKRRAAEFNRLYRSGDADLFSLRAYYQGIEQSIHFLTDEYVESIVSLDDSGSFGLTDGGNRVRIARDFRPNLPNSMRKTGGYNMTDLKGLRSDNFVPQLTPVTDGRGESLGYISQNTVGALFDHEGERTYTMGVLAFFLGIHPVILADQDAGLERRVARFQSNIAEIMDGNTPAYVTRQERMPSYTLQRVKKDLSLVRNAS